MDPIIKQFSYCINPGDPFSNIVLVTHSYPIIMVIIVTFNFIHYDTWRAYIYAGCSSLVWLFTWILALILQIPSDYPQCGSPFVSVTAVFPRSEIVFGISLLTGFIMLLRFLKWTQTQKLASFFCYLIIIFIQPVAFYFAYLGTAFQLAITTVLTIALTIALNLIIDHYYNNVELFMNELDVFGEWVTTNNTTSLA